MLCRQRRSTQLIDVCPNEEAATPSLAQQQGSHRSDQDARALVVSRELPHEGSAGLGLPARRRTHCQDADLQMG